MGIGEAIDSRDRAGAGLRGTLGRLLTLLGPFLGLLLITMLFAQLTRGGERGKAGPGE